MKLTPVGQRNVIGMRAVFVWRMDNVKIRVDEVIDWASISGFQWDQGKFAIMPWDTRIEIDGSMPALLCAAH